ncbi:dynactin arp1 p62 subunit ro2 like [Lecanosticta acicola]|uniref:Dynactin subunit 4 n=1 Tax=Lecanosticta acicola TaxID=111012 RepID=A0AAI8Z7K5_9PEZI|nr:dynactin arp1 p62 subunit ro2 like [Lecanosticta acicola]
MAISFPYTRYACPCSETSPPASIPGKRSSQLADDSDLEYEDTFNSHDPRANFSLYPLENLLFCDECNAIRCPKCWQEELMYWYCPNCLFEVPSSGVRSDGNRCVRHCYNCPQCAANLSITTLPAQASKGTHLTPGSASRSESYILSCHFCEWSSLDVGLKFDKATKITEQLHKRLDERKNKKRRSDNKQGQDDNKERSEEHDDASSEEQEQGRVKADHDDAFKKLQRFYNQQLSETTDQSSTYSNSPYSSPNNLARIMSLYGGLSYSALKKTREKPQPMREAEGPRDGMATFTAEDGTTDDEELLERLKLLGLAGTTSQAQRLASPPNYSARTTEQLLPTATQLVVRRGKRCRTCRIYLARPDQRSGGFRYKIRLLSLNYIPRLVLRPLNVQVPPPSMSFQIRPGPVEEVKLQPHHTQQYILTVRNPIFEPVQVTLATRATTPGEVASRVTILCPSFTVGPASDRFEDVLADSGVNSDGSRKGALASLTGSTDPDRQPEAGKIWERSRNSTSVILEVVPGALKRRSSIVSTSESELTEKELAEDDDILEIPIYVRVEWEAVPHAAEVSASRERRPHELAYWCVLGVGRIAEG